MRDFIVAIGLAFALEGLLMARFVEPTRRRMAAFTRKDPNKLGGVGLGAHRRCDRLRYASAALVRF
jgi:uncharacterized protein YjeT (DUF2065 family)